MLRRILKTYHRSQVHSWTRFHDLAHWSWPTTPVACLMDVPVFSVDYDKFGHDRPVYTCPTSCSLGLLGTCSDAPATFATEKTPALRRGPGVVVVPGDYDAAGRLSRGALIDFSSGRKGYQHCRRS